MYIIPLNMWGFLRGVKDEYSVVWAILELILGLIALAGVHTVFWGMFLMPFGISWDWFLHLGWESWLFGVGGIALAVSIIGTAILQKL